MILPVGTVDERFSRCVACFLLRCVYCNAVYIIILNSLGLRGFTVPKARKDEQSSCFKNIVHFVINLVE